MLSVATCDVEGDDLDSGDKHPAHELPGKMGLADAENAEDGGVVGDREMRVNRDSVVRSGDMANCVLAEPRLTGDRQ